MIQEHGATDKIELDFARLLTDWREYAAMQNLGAFDDVFGDELSVPILYEP